MLANGPGDQVESYQRLKNGTRCLSIIKYESKRKLSNPGKRVASFPTPWCSSNRKGRLRITL